MNMLSFGSAYSAHCVRYVLQDNHTNMTTLSRNVVRGKVLLQMCNRKLGSD